MEAACDFYLTLGFMQIVETPHYARFHCLDGDASFSLSLTNEPFNSGVVMYFECQTLDSQVELLINKGIKFKQLPQDQSYLWREAILLDPSGNKIKLYWAGENRLNPPWQVQITK